MSWMLGPLREGIMTILIVAGPIILAAAAVGLLIGILQAATQIQDQAIPSALKLIGVLLLLVFMGMWMFSYITNFTEKTIGRAFAMVINNRTPITYPERKPPANSQAQTLPSEAGLIRPLEPLSPASNGGPFQATLAPPMQSFNNALQSAAPPSNLMVRSAPPSMNLSYAGPSGYPNQAPPSFNQAPGQAGGYTYPTQIQNNLNYPAPAQATQAPVASINQTVAPNTNAAPAPAPTKTKSTPSERRPSPPVNRVVLQSNKEADLPGPVQIRPRLPGYTTSTEESSSSNYSNTPAATGDRLDPPGINKSASAGAETSGAWW